MYSVRIYKSTGLNAVNIIDKPSRLNDDSIFDFEDLPALNILQNVFLDSVRVKVSWEKIKNADYCRIGNSQEGYFYYFVLEAAGDAVLVYGVWQISIRQLLLTRLAKLPLMSRLGRIV